MPDLTKVSGVANADIDKIDGVAAADISKVSGVTKPSAVTTATRWIIAGDAGNFFIQQQQMAQGVGKNWLI